MVRRTTTPTQPATSLTRPDPVRRIPIIPGGMSLGVTFSAPDADRFNYRGSELLAKFNVTLGGRAAEELVLQRAEHRRRV
jgi:cell division protease FtsH